MLADDNEDAILSLDEVFRMAEIDHPLFVVYDGQHAIDYLAGRGIFQDRRKYPLPCLLLLSTDLAEKTGWELLDWVRQKESPLRLLPVILLGSSAQNHELKQARERGANDYVPKSLAFEEKLEWARGLKNSWLH